MSHYITLPPYHTAVRSCFPRLVFQFFNVMQIHHAHQSEIDKNWFKFHTMILLRCWDWFGSHSFLASNAYAIWMCFSSDYSVAVWHCVGVKSRSYVWHEVHLRLRVDRVDTRATYRPKYAAGQTHLSRYARAVLLSITFPRFHAVDQLTRHQLTMAGHRPAGLRIWTYESVIFRLSPRLQKRFSRTMKRARTRECKGMVSARFSVAAVTVSALRPKNKSGHFKT